MKRSNNNTTIRRKKFLKEIFSEKKCKENAKIQAKKFLQDPSSDLALLLLSKHNKSVQVSTE